MENDWWSKTPYLYTSFDAAVYGLKELIREMEKDGGTWGGSHEIQKWIPSENGEMKAYIGWILNSNEDIWYFHRPRNFRKESWKYGWNQWSMYNLVPTLELPTPFIPGDIIIADQRPFIPERRLLVLENPTICCGMICAYMNIATKGIVSVSTFNRSCFLSSDEMNPLSPLYRVARFKGELPEEEAPLAALSAAIKTNPETARDISGYISRNEVTHIETEYYCGVEWESLKDEFNL
jgi:hypothetical protein